MPDCAMKSSGRWIAKYTQLICQVKYVKLLHEKKTKSISPIIPIHSEIVDSQLTYFTITNKNWISQFYTEALPSIIQGTITPGSA